ncbi:hypothetical protein [Sinomonas sp. B1-1]|uniref:hypothetical protein n=1 Tax=Sinomonas sp. B1-1 TaxID=3141454 RepID=UPI003D26585E
MGNRRPALALLSLLAALPLSGCFPQTGPAPSAPPSSYPASSAPAPSAPSPSPASAPGSPTPTAGATPASAPPSSSRGTPSPTAAGTTPATAPPAGTAPAAELPERVAALTIYYVAVGDGGVAGPAIGCGDSLVATSTAPERFRDQVAPSMRRLLADHRAMLGQSGLYNALYQSDLTYEGAAYDGRTITVYLSGTFTLAGAATSRASRRNWSAPPSPRLGRPRRTSSSTAVRSPRS